MGPFSAVVQTWRTGAVPVREAAVPIWILVLGGAGIVIVKVAKPGHDMRFDIPVVGEHTLKLLRKVKAAVLAVEAGRTILLDRPRLVDLADRSGLCMVAVTAEG